MKIILLAISLFFLTFATFGQASDLSSNRCNLTSSTLPPIKGLKLGMSREDVLRLLNAPSLASIESESSDYQELQSFGVFKSKMLEGKTPITRNGSETTQVSFDLYDNQVSKFLFSSTKLLDNSNGKEFITIFSKTLNIPKECLEINNTSKYSLTAKGSFNDFGIDVELSSTFVKMSFFILGIDEKILELNKRVENGKISELNKLIELEKAREVEIAKQEAEVKKISDAFGIENKDQLTANSKIVSIGVTKTSVKKDDTLPEICNLKLADISEIRGLRLGMTQNQVLQNYPNCRNEVSTNCFYRAEDVKYENLRRGLDALSINFEMDSSTVKEFSIIYDDSIKWLSMKEFAETISKSLNLPNDKWIVIPDKKKQPAFNSMKQICNNYIITVDTIEEKRPSLTITKSEQLLKFEENQRQQNSKKLFKP